LPSKKIFGSNMDPVFVEERRVALEEYLREVASLDQIWTNSDFIAFLEDNSTFLLGTQVSSSYGCPLLIHHPSVAPVSHYRK